MASSTMPSDFKKHNGYLRSLQLSESIKIAEAAEVSTAKIRQGNILYRHSTTRVQQRNRRVKRHHAPKLRCL